jgi:hypothetical protein
MFFFCILFIISMTLLPPFSFSLTFFFLMTQRLSICILNEKETKIFNVRRLRIDNQVYINL